MSKTVLRPGKIKSKKHTSLALDKSVDTAVSLQNKDVLVETPRKDLRRLTEVFAHASPDRR